LGERSKTHGRSPAQVALRWLMQQPGVTTPIFGARTMEQLDENLGSLGWELVLEEISQLNAASDVPLPSPYNFIAQYTRKKDGD